MVNYKDSGLEWIGKIPETWKVDRFKNKFKTGKGLNITKGDLVLEGIPVVSYGQVHSKKNTGTRLDDILIRYIPQDIADNGGSSKVNVGDFIFADTSEDITGCGNAVYVDKEMNLYAGYHSVIAFAKNPVESKYFAYLFLTDCWRSQIRMRVTGIKVFSISQAILNETTVIHPHIVEQKRIADYLDEKCGEIDSLIELQAQMIEKLKAYKQSIITETVTKGLVSNVKLVSSGIDWIGKIPEGWKVKPFKEVFRTGRGLSFTKADLVKDGIPVISYGQIHSKQNTGTRIDDVLIRFVPSEIIRGGEASKVNVGDFIFADTSEDLCGCGNCVYVNKEIGLYAGYHTVIAFSKRNESNAYLAYLFLTDCWRSQIRCRVSGIKVFSISQAIIKQTSVILPSKEEQYEIASYLDEKCAYIDRLVTMKQQKIEKLKDYKKSVIYEVVTGKTIIE